MNVALRRLGRQITGSQDRRRRAAVRWRITLAAVLVAWQTLGVLHAIGHLSDLGGPDSPGLPQHGAVCMVCLAHAGSGGALPAKAPSLPAVIVPTAVAPTRCITSLFVEPILPYQVRAPPTALA